MNRRLVCSIALVALTGAPCAAQSLFRSAGGAPAQLPDDPATPLYGMSLYAVEPPQPREFSANDLVTIVVAESTEMKREQDSDFSKDYRNEFDLIEWPALRQFLFHLRGPATADTFGANPLASNTNDFEGEAEYERKDDISTRVTARVLEVKPNGTLLLEAKTTLQTDDEIQTITLSGYCRGEDVTDINTVRSSQMFNLVFNVQHEGEMRKANKKGWIPRVLETIFNF
ncbi:MAG: flagellar basal body L-ring protein FlgH [Phycisphaerales bacterium]